LEGKKQLTCAGNTKSHATTEGPVDAKQGHAQRRGNDKRLLAKIEGGGGGRQMTLGKIIKHTAP